MGHRVVILLTVAAALIVGCGNGSSDEASIAPSSMTEQRDGARCATPCARLHRSDRVTGDCNPRAHYSDAQGVMGGLISANFRVSERSRRGCVITGYPTVRMIDSAGHQLPTHVVQRTDLPPLALRVRRGHPVYLNIEYRWSTLNAQAYCRPAPHALRMRLPGTSRTLTVPLDGTSDALRVFTPCGGELWISPL
jgi:hypothetical protein